MIDLATETLLTLSQAAAILPSRPSTATLWRWRTKGVKGRKLECISIGGKVLTSVESLQRFAQQQGDPETPASGPPRTVARRERDIDRAERELREYGI